MKSADNSAENFQRLSAMLSNFQRRKSGTASVFDCIIGMAVAQRS
jgi:hypothetical protein